MTDAIAVIEAEMIDPYDPYAEVSTLSVEDFAAKSAKDRDVALFLLLRRLTGDVQYLRDKVIEVEEKAHELMSPEGLSEITNKLMGSIGGGMLGGLLR